MKEFTGGVVTTLIAVALLLAIALIIWSGPSTLWYPDNVGKRLKYMQGVSDEVRRCVSYVEPDLPGTPIPLTFCPEYPTPTYSADGGEDR